MRVLIIAEAGVNHNGSLEMARQLVQAAAQAGADMVKFQTFRAEKIVSRLAPKAEYQLRTTQAGESQLDMVHRLELSPEAHRKLVSSCRQQQIDFLSAPFDLDSLELLLELGVSAIKIPSGEITNAPLLVKIGRSGRPVFMSTGMANLGEVEQALGMLAFGYLGRQGKPTVADFQEALAAGQKLLRERVTLLHCTTEYPAPFEDVNLKAMDTLAVAFGLPVGYSDHTQGIIVPIAAAARGAGVIEKHFTLDKNLPGPDHRASLDPEELQLMVQSIRQVEQALGSGRKFPTPSEWKNLEVVRKSLVAAKDIKKGEEFSEDNLTCKRPGGGISPLHFWEWLGQVAERDYQADEFIS